ncbi:MAG: phosphate signaling complex protein PhoU [Chloroflexota bacterium]
MTRELFDREIAKLKDQVLELGTMVENAVNTAVEALRQGDKKTARKVMAADQQINEKRYEIENNCLVLIATQQPMARDLRLLAAILEVITELERIGDYAKGIAHICVAVGEEKEADVPRSDLKQMAKIGLSMLNDALQAFVVQDAETARSIPQRDDEVDDLYNKVYRKLLKQMLNNPDAIDNASHLIWAAHNLERLADRVTNISERIVFVATGEIIEMDQSDDELQKMAAEKELKK